ncbi:MAG: hypothetical protein NZ658_01505 [Pirellulales bacterium]|nr:hypothetical protein [Pirellulales bacterium]
MEEAERAQRGAVQQQDWRAVALVDVGRVAGCQLDAAVGQAQAVGSMRESEAVLRAHVIKTDEALPM